jgi:hypothetical protein
MRKPRRFSLSPIYIDSRKERLATIEQRARDELASSEEMRYSPESLKGCFSAKRRSRPWGMSLVQHVVIFLFVLLLVVLVIYLL